MIPARLEQQPQAVTDENKQDDAAAIAAGSCRSAANSPLNK